MNSAVFNFDASRVLSASWDFTAKVWNRDQRDLQSDTSDAYFRIARARILAHDIDFGEVILGNISDRKIDTFIVNLNNFPFGIEDIEITGRDKDDFTILSGFAPYEIQGDAARGIEIRFAPSQAGTREAAIRITIPDVVFEAGLAGEGVEPGIYTAAENINFGEVEMGDHRDSTVSFILENKTLTPVTIDSVYITGPDTEHFDIISGGGSFMLQSGEGREMTLRYTPESFDRISGILKFEIESYPDDVSITMLGRGIPEIIDTIEIRIPDIAGAPGEIVELPVYIDKISASTKYSSVDSYIADLRFNSTLLEPVGPADVVMKDAIGYPERKIEIELPADYDDDGVMTVLQFRVGLGNQMTTPVRLENIYPSNDAKIVIKEASSVFTLEGNCLDGGPRLIDTEGTLQLSQNSPNPGITKTVIDFEVIESGYTELYVVDIFGSKVLELIGNHLLPGKYSITANVSELPAGVYYYMLKTPSNLISRRMDVIK